MPQRISGALGVEPAALAALGVFDRFVDVDSRLYVDPHLLESSSAPEMRRANSTLEKFWTDTVVVLRGVSVRHDVFWLRARRRLTFRERAHVGLGYASGSTAGAAIGSNLAARLTDTAVAIVRAGITDPKVFELVGLLEEKIGPDRISDMTVSIIYQHILQYTQRVSMELGATTKAFRFHDTDFRLPVGSGRKGGEPVLLLPRDVLRDLPVAFSWDDVDQICAYNDELRQRVNLQIGDNWKRATADNTKADLKRVLVNNPDVLRDLIEKYRQKPADPYDFNKDRLGETLWYEAAQRYAKHFPLDLGCSSPVAPESLIDIVRTICDHFRQLVESNGLCRIFWTDEKELRHERLAQLLFFAVADCYCKANNLDLSPESNSGRGPVDFKISQGYKSRVLVEVKWSTNPKLLKGYRTQLEIYGNAEQSLHKM